MKLVLDVEAAQLWDEETETFSYTPAATLTLIHSLVSISKWESKYHKPMLKKGAKTDEELLDYIKIMTVTKNVPDEVFSYGLTSNHMAQIAAYMEDPMSATTFQKPEDSIDESAGSSKKKNEIYTSEVIYGLMIAYHIPKECEKWHINRLLTLIRVCEIQNTPPKKVDPRKANARNARLNARRRDQYNTKG